MSEGRELADARPAPAPGSRRVEQALRTADRGEAYHWPTIAARLATEVRRLRAMTADDTRPDEAPDREALPTWREAASDEALVAVVAEALTDEVVAWRRPFVAQYITAAVVRAQAANHPAPPVPAVPVTAPDETLRRLSEAATPGEWGWGGSGVAAGDRVICKDDLVSERMMRDAEPGWHAEMVQDGANGRLIAAAVNYVRAALAADRTPPAGDEVHRPFTDDGVTYCGWDKHEGCGEVWPCATERQRRAAGRGFNRPAGDEGGAAP